MQHSRAFYGTAYLEEDDLKETNINHKIQLEYYTTKEKNSEKEEYGIEVIKKEFKTNEINTEISSRNSITTNSEKVIEIIRTLKKFKVTPIGLNDVLQDLLKAN